MTKTTKATRDARIKAFREQLFRAISSHMGELQAHRTKQSTAAPYVQRKAAGKDELRIGIVGGGQAGLYAALLLEQLGIDYHIFEASGERLGGRVLTWYFDDAPHQYAEMGAMRFPDNFMQDRLFRTWDYLNETAERVPGAREIPRIPYILYDSTDGYCGYWDGVRLFGSVAEERGRRARGAKGLVPPPRLLAPSTDGRRCADGATKRWPH